MKIAEALALRADHVRRLEQLKQRLVKNARIQGEMRRKKILSNCRPNWRNRREN